MSDRTAPAPFRRTARSPDRRQRRFVRATGDCWNLVGLPTAMAAPAANLDDGHHAQSASHGFDIFAIEVIRHAMEITGEIAAALGNRNRLYLRIG
jgi:hypothetical protein